MKRTRPPASGRTTPPGHVYCEAVYPGGGHQPGNVDPIFVYLHSGGGALGSSITWTPRRTTAPGHRARTGRPRRG